MDQQQKKQIAEAARIYMNSKGMSQAALAKYTGISESYLSNILNLKFEYKAAQDKSVEINDRYFEILGRMIGMSVMMAFWKTVQTPQFIEMISTLEHAKRKGVAKLIMGETGCGKTFSLGKFVEADPVHTYPITVSNQHKMSDIVNEIGLHIGRKLDTSNRASYRMKALVDGFRAIYMQGHRSIITIDEAENLTHSMIGLLKGLYDHLDKFTAIVVIGTDEFEDKLQFMERNGRKYPGIPQFRRRFKAGTVRLTPINKKKHFEEFFTMIEDQSLKTLLRGLCNNYGELHDFLQPALESAAENGVILTDEYFRTMYKIA